MQQCSAALAVMGTSYEDAFALFTGAQEIIQDADRVGNGLKSVAMRIRGYSEDAETGGYQLDDSLKTISGDLIDLTKIADDPVLKNGISVFTDETKNLDDSEKKYKSLVQYLGEIAENWDKFSESTQTQLLQKLFAKTQSSVGAAIIENFDQVENALTAMENSAGSADAEMEKVEETITFKLNKLKEVWVGFLQNVASKEWIKAIIDGLTKISEVIVNILETPGLNIAAIAAFGKFIISTIKSISSPLTELSVIINSLSKVNKVSFAADKQTISSQVFSTIKSMFESAKADNLDGIKDSCELLMKLQGAGADAAESVAEAGTVVASSSKKFGGLSTVLTGLQTGFANLAAKIGVSTTALGVFTGIIGAAVAAGTALYLVNKYDAEYVGKLNDEVEEITETFKTSNAEAQTTISEINSIKDEYMELAKGVDSYGNNVSLSADSFEKYNEYSNQIAQAFPQLIDGYSDAGNAILVCKDNVDALNEACETKGFEAYTDTLTVENLNKIAEAYDIAKNGRKGILPWNDTKGVSDKTDDLEKFKQTIKEYKALVEQASAEGITMADVFNSSRGNAVFKADAKKYKKQIDSYVKEIRKYGKEFDIDVSDIIPDIEMTETGDLEAVINVWLSNFSELREGLSEDSQEINEQFEMMVQSAVKNLEETENYDEESISNLAKIITALKGTDKIDSLLEESNGTDSYSKIRDLMSSVLKGGLDDGLNTTMNELLTIDPSTYSSIGEVETEINSLTNRIVNYVNSLNTESGSIDDLMNQYIEQENKLTEARKKRQEAYEEDWFGNVDLNNRPTVKSSDMQAAGYNVPDDSYSTVYTHTEAFDNKDGTPWIVQFTPILPDGEVMTEESAYDYISKIIDGASSVEEVMARDKSSKGILFGVFDSYQNDKGNTIKLDWDDSSVDAAKQVYNEVAEKRHEAQAIIYNDEGQAVEEMQGLWNQMLATGKSESELQNIYTQTASNNQEIANQLKSGLGLDSVSEGTQRAMAAASKVLKSSSNDVDVYAQKVQDARARLASANPFDVKKIEKLQQNVVQAESEYTLASQAAAKSTSEDQQVLQEYFDTFEPGSANLETAIEYLNEYNGEAMTGAETVEYLKEKLQEVTSEEGFNLKGFTSITENFGKINTAYQKVAENISKGKIGKEIASDIADVEELRDVFEGITDFGDFASFDEIETVLTSGKATAEQAQKAWNQLATSYVDAKLKAGEYSEETKQLISTQLQMRGATEESANAFVEARAAIAEANNLLENSSKKITDMSADEMIAFANEATQSESTRQALLQLYLQKVACGEITIKTSGDIDNLYKLAVQAGATTSQLQKLAQAKALIGDGGKVDTLRGQIEDAKEKYGANSDSYKRAKAHIESQIRVAEASADKIIKEASQEISDAMDDASNVSLGLGGSSNSSGGSGSGSSDKDDETDEYLEKYEKYYEKLGEMRDRDKMDEYEYLQYSRVLYKQFFDTMDTPNEEWNNYVGLKKQYESLLAAKKEADKQAGSSSSASANIQDEQAKLQSLNEEYGKLQTQLEQLQATKSDTSSDSAMSEAESKIIDQQKKIQSEIISTTEKIQAAVDDTGDTVKDATEGTGDSADSIEGQIEQVAAALAEAERNMSDDTREYLEQQQEAEYNYLSGMKELYESIFSWLSSQIEKQISKLEDLKSEATDSLTAQKEAAVSALEAEKDAAVKAIEDEIAAYEAQQDALEAQIKEYEKQQDALDDQIEAYEKQQDLLDDQIEAYEKQQDALDDQIDALNDEVDAINDANDARQREITLQKALYNLDKLNTQRSNLVYSESQGMHYESDLSGIRDARDSVKSAKDDIELANLQDKIDAIEDQKEAIDDLIDKIEEEKDAIDDLIDELEDKKDAIDDLIDDLEDQKDALDDLIDSLNDQKDAVEDYYDTLISDTEAYWDKMISESEAYYDQLIKQLNEEKDKIEEIQEKWELAKMVATIKDLTGMDVSGLWDGLVNGSKDAYEQLDNVMNSLMTGYTSVTATIGQENTHVLEEFGKLEGIDLSHTSNYLEDTASAFDKLAGCDFDVVKDGVEGIRKAFDNIGTDAEVFATVGQHLSEGVQKGFKDAATEDATKSMVGVYGNALTDGFNSFFQDSKKLAPTGTTLVSSITSSISDATTEQADKIQETGKYITDGVGDGMTSEAAKTQLATDSTTVATDTKDAMRNAFQIQSPSQLIASEVGEYVGEGVGKGMVDSLQGDKMQEFINNFVTQFATKLKEAFETNESGVQIDLTKLFKGLEDEEGNNALADFFTEITTSIENLNAKLLELNLQPVVDNFAKLKDTIQEVVTLIGGGGGDEKENDKKSGLGGSLSSAMTSFGDTSAEVLGGDGEQGDEGSGVIGRFGTLREKVEDVTAAIGEGEGEGSGTGSGDGTGSGGTLISAVKDFGDTTDEVLGENVEGDAEGGEGVIGKFVTLRSKVEDVTEAVGEKGGGKASSKDGGSLISAMEQEEEVALDESKGLPKQIDLWKDLESGIEKCKSAIEEFSNALSELEDFSLSVNFSSHHGSGSSKADGTFNGGKGYAVGTVSIGGAAYANGKVGLDKNQRALIAEQGYEGMVRDGQFSVIGKNGAEMMDLKKGDIIFSHAQTKALLEKGKIHSRGKTIGTSAYADGTPLNKMFKFAGSDLSASTLTTISSQLTGTLAPIESNIENINRNVADMAASISNVSSVNNSSSVTIGDIHVSGVQDVDSFAKAIKSYLPGKMMQSLHK